MRWDADFDKLCLLVTTYPPQHVQHNLYALRYWIEAGFQGFKRDLLQWEQTKMADPQRAERLWLVMSISLFWLITSGIAAMTLPTWNTLSQTRKRHAPLSLPILGWISLLIQLLKAQPLVFADFDTHPYLLTQRE